MVPSNMQAFVAHYIYAVLDLMSLGDEGESAIACSGETRAMLRSFARKYDPTDDLGLEGMPFAEIMGTVSRLSGTAQWVTFEVSRAFLKSMRLSSLVSC